MKNIIFLSTLCTLLGCMLLLQNCHDKVFEHTGNAGEMCNNGQCNDGYACIDNTCQCPSGFVYNGHCMDFSGNPNSYVGIGTACYCYDTLIMAIEGVGEHRSVISTIKQDDLLGSAITSCRYFERAGGDSIHVDILPMYCRRDVGNAMYVEAAGIFQPDGSINMELIFHDAQNYTHIIDKCSMLLKKP